METDFRVDAFTKIYGTLCSRSLLDVETSPREFRNGKINDCYLATCIHEHTLNDQAESETKQRTHSAQYNSSELNNFLHFFFRERRMKTQNLNKPRECRMRNEEDFWAKGMLAR